MDRPLTCALLAACVALSCRGRSCSELRNLTDPATGPEGSPARETSRVLAKSTGIPQSLAVSGGYVYWGAMTVESFHQAGGVYRVSESGGKPSLFAEGTSPYPIAASGEAITWFDVDPAHDFVDRNGSIFRRGTEAGARVVLASAQDNVRALVDDGAFVYWGAAGASGAPGFVARAPASPGLTEVLARGALNLEGIAVDEHHVYWIDRGPTTALGLGSVLYEDGRVERCPKAGGASERLVGGIHGPLMAIALGGDDVYYSTGGQRGAASGRVYRVAKKGGHATALSPHQENLEPLLASGTTLVWASEDTGSFGIWTMHTTGGKASRLTDDQARSMALDHGTLYFIDNNLQIRAAAAP